MLNRLAQILFFLLFAVPPAIAFARAGGNDRPEWRPVTPEELQMTTARVEPGADAEAIFWEVRIDGRKTDKLSYEHYVRVKIFTEKGREKYSKMDIAFEKGDKVEDIAARVIKPDGSIVELNPNDIFEQEIVKADKVKIRAKSFAVPSIAPGVIIEYQYRQVLKNEDPAGKKLLFQRDIPIQQVSYYVRPAKGSSLRAIYYNMPETKFVEDEDGYVVARMTNVPAFREEPYMPPADQARRWVLLKSGVDFTSFYLGIGFQAYVEQAFKSKDSLKDKAAELTAGLPSEEEKVRRIYQFVQNNIKNLSYDKTINSEQAEKQKIDQPDEVLKKSMGSYVMIDLLFGSLCHQAGFETSVVLAGDRSRTLYSPHERPKLTDLHPAGIAIKISGQYRFFRPGIPYMPFGSLFWFEEDVPAYLIGDAKGLWTETPLSSYDKSVTHRIGKFELSEDGTLEGTVRLEYSGQQGISRRRDDFMDTQAEREETIKGQIKKLSSSAEISDITIENFQDGSKPLTYNLKVKVPNYAQRTGKRLFLEPAFFEYGSTPVFTTDDRKFSIWFSYPWSEFDEVEIKLPKGYALDSADSPPDVEDGNKVASLKIRMGLDAATNRLVMRRNFYFGKGGLYLFPVAVYPAIKQMFGAFQSSDSHIITLKQTGN